MNSPQRESDAPKREQHVRALVETILAASLRETVSDFQARGARRAAPAEYPEIGDKPELMAAEPSPEPTAHPIPARPPHAVGDQSYSASMICTRRLPAEIAVEWSREMKVRTTLVLLLLACVQS